MPAKEGRAPRNIRPIEESNVGASLAVPPTPHARTPDHACAQTHVGLSWYCGARALVWSNELRWTRLLRAPEQPVFAFDRVSGLARVAPGIGWAQPLGLGLGVGVVPRWPRAGCLTGAGYPLGHDPTAFAPRVPKLRVLGWRGRGVPKSGGAPPRLGSAMLSAPWAA